MQVDELGPGREYQFRVRAQSAQGQSPWSDTLQSRTASDVPGSPGQPSCSKRTSSGVNVKWDSPDQENGSAVKSYRYVVRWLEVTAMHRYQYQTGVFRLPEQVTWHGVQAFCLLNVCALSQVLTAHVAVIHQGNISSRQCASVVC